MNPIALLGPQRSRPTVAAALDVLNATGPVAEQRFSLDDHPESRNLVGASQRAFASRHAARLKPGFFHRLMQLSGSFAFSDTGGHHLIPNRVDPRGSGFDHDWPAWRELLPVYINELA